MRSNLLARKKRRCRRHLTPIKWSPQKSFLYHELDCSYKIKICLLPFWRRIQPELCPKFRISLRNIKQLADTYFVRKSSVQRLLAIQSCDREFDIFFVDYWNSIKISSKKSYIAYCGFKSMRQAYLKILQLAFLSHRDRSTLVPFLLSRLNPASAFYFPRCRRKVAASKGMFQPIPAIDRYV